jgi:predicted glycosyltransferase
MYYCQHSIGLGHLVRSLAIAGALAKERRVIVSSGGEPPDSLDAPAGVEILQLPPIVSDDEGRLRSRSPDLTLDEAFSQRTIALTALYEELRPSALIVELFPFGRRKFARELLPLLERLGHQSGHRPVVICSVRDILVSGHPDKQRHDDEASAILERHFDAVIVHGDPRLALLQETFRPSTPPRIPVYYSGYIAPKGTGTVGSAAPRSGILVSAGGGRAGAELFRTAVDAHVAYLGPAGFTTKVVTGPFLPAEDFRRLESAVEEVDSVTLERFVPDLCHLMSQCQVSVSQCGYNTALDILVSRTPSVVVPHGDDREDEQARRAARLESLGSMHVIPADQLSPALLAQRIIAIAGLTPPRPDIDLDGAEHSARLVSELISLREAAA